MKNPLLILNQEGVDDAVRYGILSTVRSFFNLPVLQQNALSDVGARTYEWIRHPVPYLKEIQSGDIIPLPIYLLNIDGYGFNDVTCTLDAFAEFMSQQSDIKLISGLDRFYESEYGRHMIDCPVNGDEAGLGYVIYNIDHNTENGETRPLSCETMGFVFTPTVEQWGKIMDWKYQKNQEKLKTKTHRCLSVEDYILRDILGGRSFLKEPEFEYQEDEPHRRFKCYNNT